MLPGRNHGIEPLADRFKFLLIGLEALQQVETELVEHLKTDRAEADILYEILLKLGLDLCVPIKTRVIPLAEPVKKSKSGKPSALRLHSLGGGVLITCLAKSNLAAILSQNGIQNVRSL